MKELFLKFSAKTVRRSPVGEQVTFRYLFQWTFLCKYFIFVCLCKEIFYFGKHCILEYSFYVNSVLFTCFRSFVRTANCYVVMKFQYPKWRLLHLEDPNLMNCMSAAQIFCWVKNNRKSIQHLVPFSEWQVLGSNGILVNLSSCNCCPWCLQNAMNREYTRFD